MSEDKEEEPKLSVTERKVRAYNRRHITRIKDYKVVMAFQDVFNAKQKSRLIGFQAIGDKWGVKKKTLQKYWHLWTKGLLDPGIALSTKDTEVNARLLHEKELGLLRRTKALLLESVEEMLTKVERGFTNGKKAMSLIKLYSGMEMYRALKHTNEMINMSERGYLALLDEYSQKTKEKERQLIGHELHASVENMTDEQRAIRALQARLAGKTATAEVPAEVEQDVSAESADESDEPDVEPVNGSIHDECNRQ